VAQVGSSFGQSLGPGQRRFRTGIGNLPPANASVDIVMSGGVFNRGPARPGYVIGPSRSYPESSWPGNLLPDGLS